MTEAAALEVALDRLAVSSGAADRAYWRHFYRCLMRAKTIGAFEALLLREPYR